MKEATLHHTNRLNVTIAVMVATFLTAMDSTVVSTAMPTIISDLGGIKLFSWVYSTYLLTTAVTTPIWGKLSDLFGRKMIFTIGTSLFLLGSMLSGISQSMDQLILYRAFQGIGAGAVFPITLTIIGDMYSYEERAKMQGLFSAVWGISGILGPLVGGFFVYALTWRWIFYVNVPIGIVSMVLVWIFLNEEFVKKTKQIDYAGAVTFTIGISALLYALLSGGQSYAWNSPQILGLFAVALVSIGIFLWIQTRVKEPMLPLRLFAMRGITVSNIAGFLTSAILIGMTAYLPFWIQGINGHSATSAGLTLAPMSIGWPIGSTIGGRLMLRIGTRLTSILGLCAIVLGCVWLSFLAIDSPQWILVVIMLIVGFGFGFATTAFTVIVQSSVGWDMRGAATGSLQFLRTLGQTVGVGVFGTVFNNVIASGVVATPATARFGVASINRLLNPAYAQSLSPDVLSALRGVLAKGLDSVYVLLAVTAVLGLIAVFALPGKREVLEAAQESTA